MSEELTQKLKKIKLLLLDVDGVLTKGQIIYGHTGKEIKVFNVYDGFGIVMLRKEGLKTAILTARFSEAVQTRAEDLGFDKIVQDAYPKLKAYEQIIKELKVSDEETCFIADDLPDLGVFKRVGLAVAVANAVEEIKKEAHYTTQREGGKGAVREVTEMILKAQDRWGKIVEGFQQS